MANVRTDTDVIDDFTTLDVWYELFSVSLFLSFIFNPTWTIPRIEPTERAFIVIPCRPYLFRQERTQRPLQTEAEANLGDGLQSCVLLVAVKSPFSPAKA